MPLTIAHNQKATTPPAPGHVLAISHTDEGPCLIALTREDADRLADLLKDGPEEWSDEAQAIVDRSTLVEVYLEFDND